jgi:phage terminase small subunit
MTRTARTPRFDLVPRNEDELGPHMLALTVSQRAFVSAYVEKGGQNQAEAAREAGYGNTPSSTANTASTLLRNPKILGAIREEADKRLKSGAILAASVLVEIAMNPQHRDQYKAAVELLNRAGLVVEGVSRVIVEDHRTVEEIERRIRNLAEKVGIDPERLLGTVEDVEYEEVENEDSLTEQVERIHDAGDKWQDEQKAFDAMLDIGE